MAPGGSCPALIKAGARAVAAAALVTTAAASGNLERNLVSRPSKPTLSAYRPGRDITNTGQDGRRRLQTTTCADGSGVTVTSTEFPLLEGCLGESEDARFNNAQVEFSSDTGIILAGVTEDDPTNVSVSRIPCSFQPSCVRFSGSLDWLVDFPVESLMSCRRSRGLANIYMYMCARCCIWVSVTARAVTHSLRASWFTAHRHLHRTRRGAEQTRSFDKTK